MPVNASEVSTLTDEERTQVIKEGVNPLMDQFTLLQELQGIYRTSSRK